MTFDTFNFTHLKNWDEIIGAGVELAMDVLVHHFAIGDLANHACPKRSAGRPSEADKPKTLAAFSRAVGLDRSTVSNAAGNSEFWRGARRKKLPLQATLGLLSKARKATGWKPGEKSTPVQHEQALSYILGEIELPKPSKVLDVRGIIRATFRKLELLLSEQHKPELLAALPDPVDRELLQDAKDKLDVLMVSDDGEESDDE